MSGCIGSTLESPRPCLHVSWKVVSVCRSPRAFRIRAGHCSFKAGRQRAHGSVNFQLTPCLGAHGIILGCSEALPASVDVLNPSVLTRRGPESDLMRGPETIPAGALKLPLPRWKSGQGGSEDRTPGVLVLGCRPRAPLSHAAPYLTPDASAAKAAAGEPLAPSCRHCLKVT